MSTSCLGVEELGEAWMGREAYGMAEKAEGVGLTDRGVSRRPNPEAMLESSERLKDALRLLIVCFGNEWL